MEKVNSVSELMKFEKDEEKKMKEEMSLVQQQ